MKNMYIEDNTKILLSEDINYDYLNNNYCLFSSYKSNSWVIEKDKNIIDFIKDNKGKEIDFSSINSKYKIKKEKIYQLFTEGFLSINNNWKIENFINNRNDKYSLFILHFSEICNLNCTYCFANSKKISKKNNNSVLTFSDIKKIINIIKNSLDLISNIFAIEFNSGEIFLNQDFVFKSIEYIKEEFKNSEYEIRFPLQTNGTILNSKIINFLKLNNLSLSISLDGPEEIQNKNRPFYVGKGSFNIVYNNIKKASKNNINVGILSVINHPKNYIKLYEFILKNSDIIKGFKMNPIYTAGKQKKENITNNNQNIEFFYDELGKHYIQIIDDFLENKLEKTSFISPFENFRFALMNVLYPGKAFMCYTFPCGAGKNQLAFGYDHKIYPCQEFIDDKELSLKDFREINSLHELKLNPVINKLNNAKLPEDCKNCAYFPFCQNACASHKYHFYKNFNAKIPDCKYFKNIYKYIFTKISENSSKLKDYINRYVIKEVNKVKK